MYKVKVTPLWENVWSNRTMSWPALSHSWILLPEWVLLISSVYVVLLGLPSAHLGSSVLGALCPGAAPSVSCSLIRWAAMQLSLSSKESEWEGHFLSLYFWWFLFSHLRSSLVQFSSVQSLSRVQLFVTPWKKKKNLSVKNIFTQSFKGHLTVF